LPLLDKRRFWFHCSLLALGPFLFALVFPPFECAFLLPLAIVPYTIVALTRLSKKMLFLTYLSAVLFFVVNIAWLRFFSLSALLGTGCLVLLSLYCALYLFAYVWLLGRLGRRYPRLVFLLAPTLWIALEYLRGIVLGGFPWLFLAYPLYRVPLLIQICDLFGTYGLSFLLALANVIIVVIALKLIEPGRSPVIPWRTIARAASVLALLLAVTLAYGFFRLRQSDLKEGPTIAVVQPNIPQTVETPLPPWSEILYTLVALTVENVPQDVDLIAWPEGMLPLYAHEVYEAARSSDRMRYFDRPHLQDQAILLDALKRLAASKHSNLLAGFMRMREVAGARRHHNSAVFVARDGAFGDIYDKTHLVFAGEFVPLRYTIKGLDDFIKAAGGPVADLTPGDFSKQKPFELDGARFGVIICYEFADAGLVRAWTREGADFLVNITNEAWFRSSNELQESLAICVFRCVENRIALARAANTGVSAFIDPQGRIQDVLRDPWGRSAEVQGVLTGTLMLDDRRTLYTTLGDVLPMGAVIVVALVFLISVLRRPRPPRRADEM